MFSLFEFVNFFIQKLYFSWIIYKWVGESGQECMPQDTQQAAQEKTSTAATISADWRRSQNSVSQDVIKEWASEKSSSTQSVA